MRHLKAGRKLHVDTKQRTANFRNMVTSLMLHGRIRTTEPRAKEIRRIADRVITLGKRIPPSAIEGLEGAQKEAMLARRLHAIRLARRWVKDRSALSMIFNEYSERFQARAGGYTRITKLGRRAGDNAPMSLVELLPAQADALPVDETSVETPAAETAVESPETPAAS
jgi:large subunit ribosomal protein L17